MCVYKILSNSRRRHTIEILEKHHQIDLNKLSHHIAEIEEGKDYESEKRRAVYISIKQNHIDKLVNAGVAETNNQESVLRSTDKTSEYASIIRYVESEKKSNVDRILSVFHL